MLNGPSGPQSLPNGATHTEVKKDPTSQNPGKCTFTFHYVTFFSYQHTN